MPNSSFVRTHPKSSCNSDFCHWECVVDVLTLMSQAVLQVIRCCCIATRTKCVCVCTGRILLSGNATCSPPYCTSSDYALYPVPHFDATVVSWVFTPYDCYHHFYNLADILRCSNATASPWLLVIGDSQVLHYFLECACQCG